MNRWNRPAFDADSPEPGFFAVRLVRGGPRVAARLIYTDGVLRAIVNGEMQPLHIVDAADPVWDRLTKADPVLKVWQHGEVINEAEYDYLHNLAAWARAHDPKHPLADPRKPININALPPPY